MPKMIIPDDGKLLWAQWAVGHPLPTEDYTLRLFTNIIVLGPATVTADFIDADFLGYVEVTLLRDTFDLPVINIDHQAAVVYPTNPVFTSTDPTGQVVQGWYLITEDTEVTLACALLSTPRDMAAGATLEFDPFLLLLDEIT